MAPICGGKCVLTNKLKKEQERESKNPELKFKDFQLITGVIDFKEFKPHIITVRMEVPFYERKNLLYHSPSLDAIFHPPLV